MSKRRRWILRGVLGFLALLVAMVAAVVIALHTDWGREQVRVRLEDQLADVFVGGATVGRLEGSPFGELRARELVINGPDGKPAISAKLVKIRLALLPLISKEARLSTVIVEDADIILARDENGELQISRLTKPGPKSGWSAHLPDLQIHRAHVSYDTGQDGEWVNIDNLELQAEASLPFEAPLAASVKLSGTWRERGGLPIELEASRLTSGEELSLERLSARAGDLTVAGTDVLVGKSPSGAPALAGDISVEASRAAVARLGLGIELPADVSVRVRAAREPGEGAAHSPWTRVDLSGSFGATPVNAQLRADLGKKHVTGYITTGEIDATALSGGKIEGKASTFLSLDMAMHPDRELPVGTAVLHAWGTVEGVPEAGVRLALTSDGARAQAIADIAGKALRANVTADVEKRGAVITLHRGTLAANTGNPELASGGLAPVRGTLMAQLSASGALAPEPSLAVAGTVDGRRLRVRDLSVEKLKLAIDAKQLPAKPLGRAELKASGIVRGTMQLAELAVTAANREDGKLAVAVRTRPKQSPWLVEADALVTLGETLAVDLVRHHVRAGDGVDWRGTTGKVAVTPERIELRDLVTRSTAGSIAVDGRFYRAGRREGDVEAKVRADKFALASIDPQYRGTASANVEVARTRGRLAAKADVSARGVVIPMPQPEGQAVAQPQQVTPFDLDAKVDVREGKLVANLSASAHEVGRVGISADLAAPRDASDVRAWQRLTRAALREGTLTLERVDVAKLAKAANLGIEGDYRGTIDGKLTLTATDASGAIAVRQLLTPQTRTFGPLAADLKLEQTPAGELAPALAVKLEGLGTVSARAAVAIPARPFDPAAWGALGPKAITSAEVRTTEIVFDPAMLDRFGITSTFRGRASFLAELEAGARVAKVTANVRQLRGDPLAEPVDVELFATAGEQATTFKLVAGASGMAAVGKTPARAAVRLLEAEGRIPRSLAQLRADPGATATAPLAVTAKLPPLPAKRLLSVLGRSDIISGQVSGTIDVAGTVSAPTGRAQITASNVAVSPLTRGKPVKTLEQLDIDARWDGATGSVVVKGREPGGTLELTAKGTADALDQAVVTLRAKQFDLAPVLAFAPGAAGAASGRLDANLKLVGLDPVKAKLAGELHLTDARLPIAPQIGTLRRAKIDLVAGERDLKLAVDGRLGGGTVKANGTIGIVGASPTGGNLTLTLRDVSPIGSVEPKITADVTAKVTKGRDRWIADVAVRNATVKVPPGRGEPLKPIGAPPDMVFLTGDAGGKRPRKEEPPAVPVIEARVTLSPTYVESEELRGMLKGKITITADADSIGMVGAIEADRGDLDLFGRRYLVERAVARFDGPPDPLLDIVISHDFPEVTTITTVRGRLSKPELIMSSDPGIYSQGQLLGFLLGGEPNGEPATGNPRDRVTAAGTSLVANQIGGYVKKALPIDLDVLRYESATATSSAAVTVGSWVTRSLFVAYRRRLEARPDENTGEAEAEYWLSRRVMLEGVLGDRGISGLDLLWRKRY